MLHLMRQRLNLLIPLTFKCPQIHLFLFRKACLLGNPETTPVRPVLLEAQHGVVFGSQEPDSFGGPGQSLLVPVGTGVVLRDVALHLKSQVKAKKQAPRFNGNESHGLTKCFLRFWRNVPLHTLTQWTQAVGDPTKAPDWPLKRGIPNFQNLVRTQLHVFPHSPVCVSKKTQRTSREGLG